MQCCTLISEITENYQKNNLNYLKVPKLLKKNMVNYLN